MNEAPQAVEKPPIEWVSESPELTWTPEAMAVLRSYPQACRAQVIAESEQCARSMGFHRVTPLCVSSGRPWIQDDD